MLTEILREINFGKLRILLIVLEIFNFWFGILYCFIWQIKNARFHTIRTFICANRK